MVLRLVLLAVFVVGLVGILGSLVPSATMMGIFQYLPTTVVSVAYAGEINEIKSLVDDFIELRNNRNSDDAKELAEKLDQRINNLGLVKQYCNEKISSLKLAFEKNPYDKLQQSCPSLKDLSLTKAAQLFGQI
ncbi:MAG: hypothetical protein ACT4NJ_05330 [Nitrosopumilaceae archaeon]